MTRDEIETALREANPSAPAPRISIWAASALAWIEADRNVARFGAMVMHPKTGAPIPNPYLAIRDAAGKRLDAIRLRADPVWTRILAESEPSSPEGDPT